MKKFGAIVAALAATLLGLVAFTPVAQAAPSAYPTPNLSVSVNPHTVVSGHTFTISASSSVTCSPLTITFGGVTKSGVGKSLTATFTAPSVSKTTTFAATIKCTYITASGVKGAAILAKTSTTTRTVLVTVTPAGSSSGGGVGLPNTGGPNVWWFIAGGGAVVLGLGAVIASRRKPSSVA